MLRKFGQMSYQFVKNIENKFVEMDDVEMKFQLN